jgi:hypothetical protein
MSRARIVICPWSTVSQFAASFLVGEDKKIFYPAATSSGFLPPWSIEGLISYKPIFLPPSHPIYKGNYEPPIGSHRIYDNDRANEEN